MEAMAKTPPFEGSKFDPGGVDTYLSGVLGAEDAALAAARRATAQAGMPSIEVSATQGRLLTLLALLVGARRILEIGTLGGYSTICLAQGLAAGGTVTTLEVSEAHAEVAHRNLAGAGLDGVVEVVVGPALDTLDGMIAAGTEPFDLVFIDADKANNPGYLDRSLDLTHPGALIVVDNVVRQGRVADPDCDAADVVGTRTMFDAMGRLRGEERLEVTALQTVGQKGWDGLALALVR